MARAKDLMVEVENNIHETNELERKYAYVLFQKNEKRGGVYDENNRPRNEQVFKPYLNVQLSSSINWTHDGVDENGRPKLRIDPFSGKPRAAGRYSICYYDGCDTLFVDSQPREIEQLKFLKASTRRLDFNHGFCFVDGYDRYLKTYMDWSSFNNDSPFRVPSVEVKWQNVDAEKDLMTDGELLDLEDRARDLAIKASLKKMKMHGKYLGISIQDPITNVPLSEKSIRIEYRKKAKENPREFEKTYNDKSIETKLWITDLINNGQLSLNIIPGRVVWQKTGVEVLDVSGIKSTDIIIDNLVEYSQIEIGSDFLGQVKALYS